MCGLKDGDPPISFAWTKDGKQAVSVPDVQVVNQKFQSVLTILATSSIHAGMYVCKAWNPVSWAVMEVRLFVDGIQ